MYNIKLTFKLDKAQLPREMEKLILSFIKKTVEKADTDFFAELFKGNSPVMKSYCFSSYLPGAEFKKDKIILSDTYFNILFSDYNFNKLIFFYNAFLAMKMCIRDRKMLWILYRTILQAEKNFCRMISEVYPLRECLPCI